MSRSLESIKALVKLRGSEINRKFTEVFFLYMGIK